MEAIEHGRKFGVVYFDILFAKFADGSGFGHPDSSAFWMSEYYGGDVAVV
jgi:hypothetical protein